MVARIKQIYLVVCFFAGNYKLHKLLPSRIVSRHQKPAKDSGNQGRKKRQTIFSACCVPRQSKLTKVVDADRHSWFFNGNTKDLIKW